MHYMELGGAESALLGLLQAHDPNRADLDLFLYAHHGELMNFIPLNKVNLLPEQSVYSLLEAPIKNVVKRGYWRLAFARFKGKLEAALYAKNNKKGLTNASVFTYQESNTVKVLPMINPKVEYDLAISFSSPHYIISKKVRAKKKLGWIHTDYTNNFINPKMELQMWNQLDYIGSISDDVGNKFCEVFPSLKSKIFPIENIISSDFIRQRSLETTPYDMIKKEGCISLLSIGRFSYPKRFDEVGTICKYLIEYLRKKNYQKQLLWYIIGFGSLEEEFKIKENIELEGMQGFIKILGKRSNPYPYIKACDFYVQPSRYEGKSITVREAQILHTPVVVSNYATAQSQINDGKDGIIAPFDSLSFAEGLGDFILDSSKQWFIINYLCNHEFGNEQEIEKIYNLINA